MIGKIGFAVPLAIKELHLNNFLVRNDDSVLLIRTPIVAFAYFK
jgi:hypothetical protein